jgi:hypothetical protein
MVNINIVADRTKLGIFFIFLALSVNSCENDKNDVIPDWILILQWILQEMHSSQA